MATQVTSRSSRTWAELLTPPDFFVAFGLLVGKTMLVSTVAFFTCLCLLAYCLTVADLKGQQNGTQEQGQSASHGVFGSEPALRVGNEQFANSP